MAAKCGKCGETGQTVAHIKACYGVGEVKAAVTQKPIVTQEPLVVQKLEEAPVYEHKTDYPMDIPASKYALVGKDGVIEFFEIRRPTTGKWKGYHFADLLIGAAGDFQKIKVPIKKVAARILHDSFTDEHGNTYTGPAAGALRFSRTFSCCAACGSALSDVQSRATGFGPVCAAKLGVHYYNKAAAQALLGELPHSCEDFDGECMTTDKNCPYFKEDGMES